MSIELTKGQLALVACVCAAAALLSFSRKQSRRFRPPLPPGPKGYPLIGSLLAWPKTQEWLTYAKWREQYGNLVYANVLGTDIMVLNSLDTAKAILDDRGAVYSDRPYLHVLHDIIGWKDSPIMCTADHPHFKASRRLIYSAVGSRAALSSIIPLEEHEARRLLLRLIDAPQNFRFHLRKLAGTIILRIVYGYDVKPSDDEYVNLGEQVADDVVYAITTGNFLVDLIPALAYVPRWFPGTRWKDKADRMRASLNDALTKPINLVKRQLAAGIALPSFVSSELTRPDWDEREDANTMAWTAHAMYAAGSDTSVSAMASFFLCMTLFPDVQAKAQAEIDRVIGSHVIPTWADRERLPYVEAVIKEVLRWSPVSPQSLPHCPNADGTFGGYFIPKGTVLMPNVWGFTRDHTVYPNSEAFDPSRFLGEEPQLDPRDFVFGFGRRVCPGRQLAESSLFIVLSNVLATLKISKKLDKDGLPITPIVKHSSGAVSHPGSFDCDIKPRSAWAESMIRAAHDAPFGG